MKPERAAQARILFDGDHGDDDIKKGMPENPRDLFTANTSSVSTASSRSGASMRSGERRLCVGAEGPVPRLLRRQRQAGRNAKFFADEATKRGGHVELIDVGPEDHTGTAFRAISKIRQWFDDLTSRRP